MSDVADLKAEVLALRAENAELRKHVRMPDEPLEIDEKDFYVRAFIKWATEEQPEVKRLEAENEKLREERDMYRDLVGMMDHPDLNVQLSAENAKLRELLREILNNCCEGIESTRDMCGCYRKSDGACMADVRAIELGVDI